jgi:hypothetical protein
MSVQWLRVLERGQGATKIGIMQASDRLHPLAQSVQVVGVARKQIGSKPAQLGKAPGTLRRLLSQGLDLLANLLVIQRHMRSLEFRTSVLAILKPEGVAGKGPEEFGCKFAGEPAL